MFERSKVEGLEKGGCGKSQGVVHGGEGKEGEDERSAYLCRV